MVIVLLLVVVLVVLGCILLLGLPGVPMSVDPGLGVQSVEAVRVL